MKSRSRRLLRRKEEKKCGLRKSCVTIVGRKPKVSAAAA